ncbi:hypothetical protein L9F63_016534, partial [Diploptera punctata]
LEYDRGICDHLIDQDLEAALKAIEGDEQFDPYSLAYVKFTPSASNPHPEFADEVYFPPQSEEEEEVDKDLVMPPGSVDEYTNSSTESYQVQFESVMIGSCHMKLLSKFELGQNQSYELGSYLHIQISFVEVGGSQGPAHIRYRYPKSILPVKKSYPTTPSGPKHRRSSPLSAESILLAKLLKPSESKGEIFTHNYNTPNSFRESFESHDGPENSADFPNSQDIEQPVNDEQNAINLTPEQFNEILHQINDRYIRLPEMETSTENENTKQRREGTAYTEGGLVYLPEQNRDVLDDGLDALLDEYDALDRGFKRRERLDVKKPGPFFSTPSSSLSIAGPFTDMAPATTGYIQNSRSTGVEINVHPIMRKL